jgi:outer membrane lipoprotein-sorting protein
MSRALLVVSATAVLVAALLVPTSARAETARAVLDRAKQLNDTTRHWTDRTQRMTLIITDAHGGERRRELKLYTKRYPGDEDKGLSFFLSPPEVKGTAFLQWAHKKADDDQWLYLPEFKRTRRITAQLRDDSFMGTDFSYRDLEILGEIQDWTEEEAPTSLTGEETIDGSACHVIDYRPKQEGTSYGRIVLWLDREKLTARKMDFYDLEGTQLKTLALQKIADIGPVPTPQELNMQSLKKGSHTRVEVADLKYDGGLSDDLFTQRYLERGEAP